MSQDLIIEKDVYDAMLFMHGKPTFIDAFNLAKQAIANGGKVYVRQKYVNADPDICKVMSSEKDLAAWEAEVFQNTNQKPQ